MSIPKTLTNVGFGTPAFVMDGTRMYARVQMYGETATGKYVDTALEVPLCEIKDLARGIHQLTGTLENQLQAFARTVREGST